MNLMDYIYSDQNYSYFLKVVIIIFNFGMTSLIKIFKIFNLQTIANDY